MNLAFLLAPYQHTFNCLPWHDFTGLTWYDFSGLTWHDFSGLTWRDLRHSLYFGGAALPSTLSYYLCVSEGVFGNPK